MTDLDEFIATEKHNEQARKNLKEFAKNPDKFPNLGKTVSFEYVPKTIKKPELTFTKLQEFLNGQ